MAGDRRGRTGTLVCGEDDERDARATRGSPDVWNGDVHAANRFYLEDLAVGQLRPPLNLDIER